MQMRFLDAAGVAARLAARGEAPADVDAAVAAAGPRGASVRVRPDGLLVRAQVAVQVHPVGLGALVPAFSVTATAVSLAESGVGAG
jgi:hypothetical protein